MLYLGFFLLLTSSPWAVAVEESDVSLWFYQYPSYNQTIYNFTLNENSTCNINSSVNVSKKIIIYIHGWQDGFSDEEYNLIRALVETQVNSLIIRVEYPYQSLYPVAVATVTPYGTYVANFLLCLKRMYGYLLDNVILIGHSLGAHIIGAVGDSTSGVLKYLVGLDPAGPQFDQLLGDRLEADDAKVNMVLHTSGVLGTLGRNGKYDVYINGGISQPECNTTVLNNIRCNHLAAITRFANSLYNETLKAVKCSSYTLFLTGACDGNDVTYVDGINLDPNASGKYYVNTP